MRKRKTEEAKVTERPLGNVERAVWRQGRISLNVVQPVVLDRRISPDALRHALERVRPRYPQLSLRMRRDERGRVLLTGAGVEAPTVRVVADDGGWTREALSELAHGFDWARGPLVRFTLVQAADRTVLLVNMSHVLGDGQSLAHLIGDLLTALGDPDARFGPRAMSPPLDDLHSAEAFGHIGRLAFLGLRRLGGLLPPRERGPRRLRPQPVCLRSWDLDESATRRLVDRCRRARFSVHAALCTAFQLASREVHGPRPSLSGVYTPVDVRRRIGADLQDAFGLYASESVSRLRPHPSRRFASEATRIGARIRSDTKDRRVLRPIALAARMHPRLVDRAIAHVVDRQGVWEGLAISNLGRLDLPAAALPLIRAYGAPVFNVRRAEKSLGVVTVAGRMAFTLLARASLVDEDTLTRFRDRAMEILHGPW